jgi:hypothetical protein
VAKARKIKRAPRKERMEKERKAVLMMTASAYVTKFARKVVEAAMAKAVVKMAAVEAKAVVKVEVTDRIN